MNMLTLTAKELADRQGTDYATIQGLLKFLSVKGVVKKAGNAPRCGSIKGKTASLWLVPSTITLDLEKCIHRASKIEQVIFKETISKPVEGHYSGNTLPDGSVGVHQE